jgi:type III secretion YscU/HrpY family protein
MSDEKTEEPTAKKLREARKRGEVWKSRQLTTAGMLLAMAAVLWATGESALARLETSWGLAIAGIDGGAAGAIRALTASASIMLSIVLPILVVAVVVAVLTQVLQTGPLFTTEPLSPKLERLDPIAGIKRIFSQKNFVELIKSSFIVLVVSIVVILTLEGSLRGVIGLVGRDAMAALAAAGVLVTRLFVRVGAVMVAIAIMDVLYQRWRYQKDQRMTKDQVKREHKEAEGDPHLKRERDRTHREIVTHGVLESVREADVLVVNPTHLAVALRYDAEGELDAPEVVAKGQEDLARRMIQAAEAAGVPIMRDMPLARALFELEVGVEIPERLYEAVAVILRAAWAERDELERQSEGPGAVDPEEPR